MEFTQISGVYDISLSPIRCAVSLFSQVTSSPASVSWVLWSSNNKTNNRNNKNYNIIVLRIENTLKYNNFLEQNFNTTGRVFTSHPSL